MMLFQHWSYVEMPIVEEEAPQAGQHLINIDKGWSLVLTSDENQNNLDLTNRTFM